MTIRTALPTPMTLDQVEAVIGSRPATIMLKELDRLDDGCRELLASAPIAGIGYLDREDRPTSGYVGGTAGFTTVVDDQTVSLPVRGDMAPPQVGSGVGLVYLFPGVGEVLRLNGQMTTLADGQLTIAVKEAFIHCSRAISRAGLWSLPTSPMRGVIGDGSTARDPSPLTGPGPLGNLDIARVMANSPFLVLSSFGPSGTADTSPRGDAPGFVHRLDDSTLAIPDRKGNKRADTFRNLAHDQRVSLAALVPGANEVALISGIASMTTDPEMLESMSLNGTAPHAALIVRVTSARVDEMGSVAEARLWEEVSRSLADSVPDMNALASRQIARNAKEQSHGALSVILRPLNAIPGLIGFMTRFGLKQALAKEGYGAAMPSTTASRPRRVRIASIRRETSDVITVKLKAADRKRFNFAPGQYFTVAVEIDGHKLRRSYSASRRPGRRLFLTIKHERGGLVSTYLHERARRGDTMEVLGPNGDFTPLASAGSGDIVLIGAGSGITPLYGTVTAALRGRTGQRVVLIYGSRTEQDIVFNRSLRRLARRRPDRLVVKNLLTQPSPTWTGGVGRIGAETLAQELASLQIPDGSSFWICGPDAMMDAARQGLIDAGVAERQIHEERFVRSGVPDDPSRPPQPVTVTRGSEVLGSVTVAPGTSILQATLDAGLPMSYSCTVGDCGECAVRLLDGNVVMGTPNCLSQSQIDDKVVLTCVGQPSMSTTIDIDYSLIHGDAVGTGYETWCGPGSEPDRRPPLSDG